MGRHYFIDRGSGVVSSYSDEELAQGAAVIGTGFLIYAAIGLFSIALCAVLFAPFVTLFLLKGFVETIVINNSIFFLLTGAILLCFKLISLKTSRNIFVRFLFNAYIVVIVLYVTLYVFHFDATIYSFARVIGSYSGESNDNTLLTYFQNDDYYTLTNGNWFFETVSFLVGKFLDFVRWSFGHVAAIDNSCFIVAASEINILEVLKTCGLYLGLGGFAAIGTAIFALVLLLIAIISVAFPYCLAFVAVLIANLLINKFRFKGKIIKINK